MTDAPDSPCDDCGLPIPICNARAMLDDAVKRCGEVAVLDALGLVRAATLPAPVGGLGLRSDGTIELLAAENRNLRAEIESPRATVSTAPVEALASVLRECRTDLMLQSDYARDAAKTDARWDGIADRLRKRVHEADAALAAYEGEQP